MLEAFAKAVELYHECDDEILASASNTVPLFADVRYAPGPTAGMPRIDQQDNGEGLNQFLHRRKDNGRDHGVFPESGVCAFQIAWLIFTNDHFLRFLFGLSRNRRSVEVLSLTSAAYSKYRHPLLISPHTAFTIIPTAHNRSA